MASDKLGAIHHDEAGPFHDKIKRLGKAEAGKGHIQTLAQATVVKPLLDYITPDPEGDRNKRYKGIFIFIVTALKRLDSSYLPAVLRRR